MSNIYLKGTAALVATIAIAFYGAKASSESQALYEKRNDVEWAQRYPEAKGDTFTFCNETQLIVVAKKYTRYITEDIMRADNDVPIRCRPDSHSVIENTGLTSKSTIF